LAKEKKRSGLQKSLLRSSGSSGSSSSGGSNMIRLVLLRSLLLMHTSIAFCLLRIGNDFKAVKRAWLRVSNKIKLAPSFLSPNISDINSSKQLKSTIKTTPQISLFYLGENKC
jgi:hypothetical protein